MALVLKHRLYAEDKFKIERERTHRYRETVRLGPGKLRMPVDYIAAPHTNRVSPHGDVLMHQLDGNCRRHPPHDPTRNPYCKDVVAVSPLRLVDVKSRQTLGVR